MHSKICIKISVINYIKNWGNNLFKIGTLSILKKDLKMWKYSYCKIFVKMIKCRGLTCSKIPEIWKKKTIWSVLKFNNQFWNSWNFGRFLINQQKSRVCYHLKSLKWTDNNAKSIVLYSKTFRRDHKCCAFVMASTFGVSSL